MSSEQAIRSALVDNPEEPSPQGERGFVQRSPDKDVSVIVRTATTWVLVALLILQSVAPCCAVRQLLANGNDSSSDTAPPTSDATSCTCCRHLDSTPKDAPPPEERPREKCPFCGGVFFHVAPGGATAPATQRNYASDSNGTGPHLTQMHTSVLLSIPHRPKPGTPFLNAGMRLLI